MPVADSDYSSMNRVPNPSSSTRIVPNSVLTLVLWVSLLLLMITRTLLFGKYAHSVYGFAVTYWGFIFCPVP